MQVCGEVAEVTGGTAQACPAAGESQQNIFEDHTAYMQTYRSGLLV